MMSRANITDHENVAPKMGDLTVDELPGVGYVAVIVTPDRGRRWGLDLRRWYGRDRPFRSVHG